MLPWTMDYIIIYLFIIYSWTKVLPKLGIFKADDPKIILRQPLSRFESFLRRMISLTSKSLRHLNVLMLYYESHLATNQVLHTHLAFADRV